MTFCIIEIFLSKNAKQAAHHAPPVSVIIANKGHDAKHFSARQSKNNLLTDFFMRKIR